MRQQNTYQHAKYWQKKNIYRHDTVLAQLHFNTCTEIGVKLDNGHWYDHVPKSVEAIHEGKLTLL
jgi:hypothetical protein